MMVIPAFTTPALAASKNALPKEDQQFLKRYELCDHFAGEFNGDRSERDAELNREMAKLRCGSIDQEEKAFRKKYAHNKKVMATLIQLDAPY
ncbi:MAG: hypothetical protein EOO69_01405 [Moraxellaceae bacterium]|nr:MAG: hypothetical protein EOO69_01405 [Moraxellaceae bacterium]